MRVLVVEDDDGIAGALMDGLTREGYEAERAATGRAALAAAPADLVLLDLRLPDIDGYEVCRELRKRSDMPIIMISARGEEADRVVGLELGADDYIVKPFGFREVLARMRAVLRRSGTRHDRPTILVGSLEVDLKAHRVLVAGEEVSLTAKEFDLLVALASEPGCVRSRQELMERVWGTTWYEATKTIDVHVGSLRKKVGPDLIETVRGVGFRLVER